MTQEEFEEEVGRRLLLVVLLPDPVSRTMTITGKVAHAWAQDEGESFSELWDRIHPVLKKRYPRWV
jgi:hypothetical protein